MTESATSGTTPVAATSAVSDAQVTALPSDLQLDPGQFVPPSTRDNYLAIVRDQAQVRGEDVGKVRDELVAQFRTLHERQPFDGYDHLAAWLERADLSAGTGPTGMQVLAGRVLESARRDPYQAVIGDQAAVQVAVAAQQTADDQAAAVAASPSVDPSTGMLPNAGPLPVPPDVTATDPAVAEQQQAAANQTNPDAGGVPPTTTTTPPSPPAAGDTTPPPADNPPADPPPAPAAPAKGGNGGKSSPSSSS